MGETRSRLRLAPRPMRNFLRTVRLAARQRALVAAALACSLLIGALWGANIGTLYPFVEVVLRGESIPDWLARDAREAETAAARAEVTLADLRATHPAAGADLDRSIAVEEARLAGYRRTVERARSVQPYADRYLPSGPFQTLVALVACLLLGSVLRNVCLAGHQLLVELIARRTWLELQDACFDRTVRLDQRTLDRTHTGDLMACFADQIAAVTEGVKALAGIGVREPLKVAACLAGAAAVNWRLLAVSLLLIPIAAALIAAVTRAVKAAHHRALGLTGHLYHRLAEAFSLLGVIRAYGLEEYERDRLRGAAREVARQAVRLVGRGALARGTTEVIGLTVVGFALLLGTHLLLTQGTHVLGVRVADRPLTAGGLLVFFAFLVGAHEPARKIADLVGQLQRALPAADRVYQLLDDRPPGPAREGVPVGRPRELVFDRVTFAYGAGAPALADVSFRVRAGEALAVVGPSGAGKTTLTHLVLGLYEPTAGAVRADGTDLRAADPRAWRRHLAVVHQSPVLFDETIGENIRIGALAAGSTEIAAAARTAGADGFIADLPGGYDYRVGERGGLLSGGQRQRVAVARAILRDPAVLILDEATSQLDAGSEGLLQAFLGPFLKDRITVLVTHRPSTLRLATRVLVLDAGRVVDAGTHAELLGRCALYRRLCYADLEAAA